MAALLRSRWLRRLVSVPVTVLVLVGLLTLLPFWLLVAAFVSRFVPGKWRLFRLAWFSVVYAVIDVITVAVLFVYWVASGFGRALARPGWQARHVRLLAWGLRRLSASARFTFGLTLDVEGDAVPADDDGPVLVLARRSGIAHALWVIDGVVNGPTRRHPRLVLPARVQLDPALDVLLTRIGARFVTTAAGAADGADPVVTAVAAQSAADGPADAIVVFANDRDQAGRCLQAATDACGEIPTVFVGHAGLTPTRGLRDLWRHLPMDRAVVAHRWSVAPSEVPASGPARDAWLQQRWDATEHWIDSTSAALDANRAERAAAEASARRAEVTPLRRRLRAAPSTGAVIGALVMWWLSLTPSLLPRTWLYQGLVGGACIAIGWGVGELVRRAAGRIARFRKWTLGERWRERFVTTVFVVCLVAVPIGSVRWYRWQRDQARLVAADVPSASAILPMLLATALVTAILLTIARLIQHAVLRLDRAAARRIPLTWARWVAGAVVVVVALLVGNLAVRGFTNWADQNFGAFDGTTAEGIEPPTSSNASGGPGSLVEWDDLGFQGRNFIGELPTVADLQSFHGDRPVVEPIRVYVGLKSADSHEERVALAVQELERTGAFEREVLVVVTPTGTGWVNPDAARTIEYLYAGDTAIVSVQYSFLPSWVAALIDTDSPHELGVALYDGIRAAWEALPADGRPKFVVYGESLGSLGGETAFEGEDLTESLANMAAGTDAALFVGPTRDNAIFGSFIDERAPGSPSWRPVIDGQPNVRIANTTEQILEAPGSWTSPRLLWLHHPSDAIGTWQPPNIWSDPGWADNPPPHDVPEAARWIPMVSFIQEAVDLMNGFSASPGFGHDYRNHFVQAWAALLPPEGWTDADSQRLQAHLGL